MRKSWSEDDLKFLKDNAEDLTISELASELGRTYSSVKKKLYKTGIYHKSLRRRWSQEEDDVIRNANGKVPYQKIAQQLGRSYQRVVSRALELKVKKRHQFFTPAEEDRISELIDQHKNVQEIAECLDRTYASINCHLRLTGRTLKPKPFFFTPEEAAYIAGLLDGEGSVSVNTDFRKGGRPYITPYVMISGTNPDLLNWLEFKLGTRCKTFNQSGVFKLFIYNPRVLELLEILSPYLIVKAQQAELLLELLKNKRLRKLSRREVEIAIELRKLNGRNFSDNHGFAAKIRKKTVRLEAFLSAYDDTELKAAA